VQPWGGGGRGQTTAAVVVCRIAGRDDMNIDIDEDDCIVVETKGSEVGKRSAGLAGLSDPANAAANAPSSEAGKRAVDEGGGGRG